MANPFTKPSITAEGTKWINFPNFKSPENICIIPVSKIAAKRYSTPCIATSDTITTAIAPVAPEIIPLLPPKIAVIIPTKKAAYKPTNGCTPATKAKAIASGTNARATVSPDKISTLGFLVKSNLSIKFIKITIFVINNPDQSEVLIMDKKTTQGLT